jgi:hypothetical protein
MGPADLAAWLHSDAGQMALAGAAGGLVRWLTLRENWRDGAVSLVVGSICALYLGPLAEPLLAPAVGRIAAGEGAAGFSSFVVGLGGIGFAGFVIETLRRFRAGKAAADGEK